MVKQLIAVATPLQMHNAPEAIQYAQTILDFVMLSQYISHDYKMRRYMEYAL